MRTGLIGMCAFVALTALAQPAEAQTGFFTAGAHIGSGVSFGNGGGETVTDRTPIFFDLGMRAWTDEAPDLVFGGMLRVEVEGRTSVGIVPRAELVRRFGALEVRPLVGIPFFFAPFSMLGAEVGAALALKIGDAFNLVGTVFADAYFWGSDIPEDSIVVMFNGMLGIELAI